MLLLQRLPGAIRPSGIAQRLILPQGTPILKAVAARWLLAPEQPVLVARREDDPQMPIRMPVLAGACALMLLSHSPVVRAASTPPDTRPAWAIHNWGAQTHDNGRAIYGVGVAKPTAGAELRELRHQAELDAKQTVLRQVETFTTAVQADASPQGRAIAVGLQAYGPLVQHLIRSMDHYVAADGTHYSLMAVQANTIMAVAQKARDKGLTLETLDSAGFEAAFDKAAKLDVAVPAFIGQADSSWSDFVPKQQMDKIPKALGPEPAWVSAGPSASLPSSVYLCGVGKGSSAEAAAGGGAAALSQALLGQAQAAAAAVDAARGPLGLSAVRGPDSKDAAKAAWGLVAPFVLGQQVWTNKKGTVYVASCVLRVKTYVAIKERLKIYDTQIATSLGLASGAAPGSDVKKDNLNKAYASLQERAALVAMLRSINISGLGQAGTFAMSDLAAAQNPLAKAPRLAVAADGPYWLGLANAVVDGLHNLDVEPGLVAVTPTYELLLTAKISLAPNDKKQAKNAKGQYEAAGRVQLELQDLRAGASWLSQSFEATGTATTHIFDAERAVMRALNQKAADATRQAVTAHK